jgi:hypothetical protein
VVEIEPHWLSLSRACGALSGFWRADTTGLFVAHIYGSTGCPLPTDPPPGWLAGAVAFGVDGAGPMLLDPHGRVVARLRPKPATSSTTRAGATVPVPPPLADEVRREFDPPAPLPAPLVPAGRDVLVGRWIPAGGHVGRTCSCTATGRGAARMAATASVAGGSPGRAGHCLR